MSTTPHIFLAGPKHSLQIAELYFMAAADSQIARMINTCTVLEGAEIDPVFNPVKCPYAELEPLISLYISRTEIDPNQLGQSIGAVFLNAFAERHADSGFNQHPFLQYASDARLMVRTF